MVAAGTAHKLQMSETNTSISNLCFTLPTVALNYFKLLNYESSVPKDNILHEDKHQLI